MPSGEVAPSSASVTVGTGELHQFQYPDDMGIESRVEILPDEAAAVAAAAGALVAAANASISTRGSFALAISGGSALGVLESASALTTDWSKWHVFFADERVVPISDDDSNFKSASQRFFSKVSIPRPSFSVSVTLLKVNNKFTRSEVFEIIPTSLSLKASVNLMRQ